MLTIREEQMRAFRPAADVVFAKRVATSVRANHGDASVRLPAGTFTVRRLPEETLRRLVRGGIARAREYELSHESALAAFVVLMFETAPNFDRHPVIRRILTDENVPPNSRVDRLLEEVTEQNWEAVKQSYDAGAWAPEAPQ
ncbi:MAG: hypothetical protein ACRD68_01560 [Pyrinomonadaceae bacterium]